MKTGETIPPSQFFFFFFFQISHNLPFVFAQDLGEFIILEHYKYMFRAQLLSNFTKISSNK